MSIVLSSIRWRRGLIVIAMERNEMKKKEEKKTRKNPSTLSIEWKIQTPFFIKGLLYSCFVVHVHRCKVLNRSTPSSSSLVALLTNVTASNVPARPAFFKPLILFSAGISCCLHPSDSKKKEKKKEIGEEGAHW